VRRRAPSLVAPEPQRGEHEWWVYYVVGETHHRNAITGERMDSKVSCRIPS
jgi:hypothetical protein